MDAKYQRIKVIGQGSFGKAYLVKNAEADALCVVKQLDISQMSEKDKQDAVREAAVLKKMVHPNIVSFQEVFVTRKGKLCIVMDYADGGDVHKALQKLDGELLPEETLLEWFVQICFALLHVHDRKVLHRDLKTQNIFLMTSGQVKLGDFGVARVLEATKDKAQTMVGTPYYLSPEILQERPYSYKSDVWSCGVVLYELATLRRPFDADSLVCLASLIIKGEFPDPDERYSRDLVALIRSMLQKNDRRRPSIREVLKKSLVGEPMRDANAKYSLGLDLSEFDEGGSGLPPPAEADAAAGAGLAEGAPGAIAEGEESSEDEVPASSLARSVRQLSLTRSGSGVAAAPAPEADMGTDPTGAGLTAKAEALRAYLTEQLPAAAFREVYELVLSSSSHLSAKEIEARVEAAVGPEKARVLLPMFQLLCFLEGVAQDADYKPVRPKNPVEEEILQLFRRWDADGDGFISKSELQAVLCDLGMKDSDATILFCKADVNHDNKIAYGEFIRWVFSDSSPKAVQQQLPVQLPA